MENLMNKGVITITDAEFADSVSKATTPVLVYFWASWCGPCKLMSPSIEKAANHYSDRLTIFKMEVDPNPETVKKYKVEGVPALRLIKGIDEKNETLASSEGAISKDKLFSFLDENLNSN